MWLAWLLVPISPDISCKCNVDVLNIWGQGSVTGPWLTGECRWVTGSTVWFSFTAAGSPSSRSCSPRVSLFVFSLVLLFPPDTSCLTLHWLIAPSYSRSWSFLMFWWQSSRVHQSRFTSITVTTAPALRAATNDRKLFIFHYFIFFVYELSRNCGS